ncbi:MAG: phage terminase large subunit family protein [Planctomycetota bacterium]|nr:phage terminase large subunit family protein [Planctomycetota bacterium]
MISAATAENLRHHLDVGGRDLLEVAAAVLRPPARMLTSQWAERHRYLKEGTTEKPGRWSNDYFPYLAGIQDAIDEALAKGKRGVALMKSGQGGGSEAMINALGHLLDEYPGPALYMLSKDELARSFARERFDPLVENCEPLARKSLTGRGTGSLTHVKRFADCKVVLQGGRSILNLQSSPYKYVFVDEYDSMQDEMEGSDPLALAEIRTDAFPGSTLIVAFAHPSTRARGVGKLYHDKSDMRRGFVVCPHCAGEFWLQWDHVKAVSEEGMTQAQAERDKRCYHYFAPCCGAEISDAQRALIVRKVIYKSTLPADEADRRPYIGVHFSQLYMPNKSIEFLSEHWIEALDDDGRKRVFMNKRMGEVYDPALKEATADEWSRLVCVRRRENDPEYYTMGQVPAPVRFLTAGQDSRSTELHYAVWGWGRLRDEAGYPIVCGWLIDCGVVRRPYSLTLEESDLRVFDQLLYERSFAAVDGRMQYEIVMGLHDWSWQPLAVENYCLRSNGRAVPCRGAALDSKAASHKPTFAWGAGARRRIGSEELPDPRVKVAQLNTFRLKENFFPLVGRRFITQTRDGIPGENHGRLVLPLDVPQWFIQQSSSEYLTLDGKVEVWKHKGPNHVSDCNLYAYACALEILKLQDELPFAESEAQAQQEADRARRMNRSNATRPIRWKY